MINAPSRLRGFTLLPVMLAMGLIAAVAFTLNRDNGINAVMVSNQQDADRARFAAEAGLQAVNAAVQARNCAGGYPVTASPVVNNNFGGASYSAYATSAGGNTTGLVSTGAFNGTSVTLTRSAVYAYQATPKTYTLQPGAAAGLDTYIDSTTEANFGSTGQLAIKKNQQSLLFKFNLSAFPSGSRPLSATLSIHASGGLLGGVDFYRMTSAWIEGSGAISPLDGATWNTLNGTTAWSPGGEVHPARLNANTKVIVNGSVDLDVTQAATAWLEGRYPNHGVLIRSTGELGTFSSPAATIPTRPSARRSPSATCCPVAPRDRKTLRAAR
ncbi:MAG: DNRLRE domain-containing protein [Proteobacteria bacterium]|nr:DNRLRE domain-containing protein [Pseudomonadota bacterium]